MRRLLAEMEIPVEPPFGGVRQKTFEELERSLLEMEEAYSRATESGDRTLAQQCRNVVIEAKDHARLAAHSANTNPKEGRKRRNDSLDVGVAGESRSLPRGSNSGNSKCNV